MKRNLRNVLRSCIAFISQEIYLDGPLIIISSLCGLAIYRHILCPIYSLFTHFVISFHFYLHILSICLYFFSLNILFLSLSYYLLCLSIHIFPRPSFLSIIQLSVSIYPAHPKLRLITYIGLKAQLLHRQQWQPCNDSIILNDILQSLRQP